MTEWEAAQKWEAGWWGLKSYGKWEHEVEKQARYAVLMGMPDDLDFGEARILDVGCGPVSILLRSRHGFSIGVDPLPMSAATVAAYHAANAMVWHGKAEAFEGTGFDEVWCYNCLQHVEDPIRVLEMMTKAARNIRLFEWTDVPPFRGHPHMITEAMLSEALAGWERRIWVVGELADGGLEGKYVAAHVERREP